MALLDESARGVYAIAPTPFTDTGEMDWSSTDRLMEFYRASGVDGVTILGVMGEAPKLSPAESEAFIARSIAALGGRLPVIVGVSNPGLKLLGDLARRAMELGAAGVMVAPISGLKTEEQIYAYIAAIVRELGPDIPIVLQDYPQLTAVFLSPGLINRLFAEFPTIKMLKHEESPGLRKLSQVRAADTDGSRRRRVSILTGNGGLHLPQELARGADGAMTGFAFPEMLVEVCRRFAGGDAAGAEDIFDAYLPVVRHEQQPGIGLALRKETLHRRGVLASARLRTPGPLLDAADHRELTYLLQRLERAVARLPGPALRLAGA